jgi:TRAP-type uncharacterized transport system substrate-binding protein
MILSIIILIIIITYLCRRSRDVIENYYNLFIPSLDKDVKLISDTNIFKYNNDKIKYEYYYKLIKFGFNTNNYMIDDQHLFVTTLIKNILAYSNIINIKIVPCNTSYQIFQKILDNSIDIGITSTPILMRLYNSNLLTDNISYISNLNYHYLYIITNKYTNISSLKQLKNKKINLGVQNTTVSICAENILDELNLVPYATYMPYNDNIDIALLKLANQNLDVVFFTDTYPSKYLAKYNKNKVYQIIPIEDIDNKIFTAKYSYYTPTYFYDTIPTYKFSNIMICNTNIDEAITYHTIKQIFTNKSNNTLQPPYPDIKETIYIPLHPGSRKYLIETGNISLVDHPNCAYLVGNEKCSMKQLTELRLDNNKIIHNKDGSRYDTNLLRNKLLT